MKPKPFTAFLLIAAALALLAVSFASAAELEWDQKRVAALVQDLVEPLGALRADLENRPAVSEKEALHAAILKDVKDLQLRARELAQRLASGAGRAETDALFREVQALESQATKRTLEYPAPFDMHVYVDRVQRITIQLVRYYGESSAGEGSRR
jgi:hypothetical protein